MPDQHSHRQRPHLGRFAAIAPGLALLGALAGCGTVAAPGQPYAGAHQKTCADLNAMTVPAQAIGLPTGGARVIRAETVAAAGDGAKAIGVYCKVLGEIAPVDPAAPAIRFQLDLPAQWNGRALMLGGGGYNGTIPDPAGNLPAGPIDRPTPLGRGYATFSSDSGHQANATTSRDGSFGLNDEALRNFAGDAIKKTHDAALHLIAARYGAKPGKTYFAGGSTGGREALLAAGNWPDDFNGVIALYPAWNAVALNLQFGRITQALARPGAYPSPAQRKRLYDAAMAACDGLDGAPDGVISNVDACNAAFDPATATLNGTPLRCPDGGHGGDNCLSDVQIDAFKVISTPLQLGYTLASGESTYPGFNTWGTNWGTGGAGVQSTILTLGLGTLQPASPMPAVSANGSPPYHSTFWDQWVRYFVTRDSGYDWAKLDGRNPGPWQARIVQLNGLQDANRTDLSAFQARGGKILIAHGTADALVSTQATRQYMERLRTAMGGNRVDSFVRYYEIAGYGHVFGTAFNAAWDSLALLENWVEWDIAPADPIVTDTAGVPGRTRPLCTYPAWPQYKGRGSLDEASSFRCTLQ
ncbi:MULTISPECIES: tannase/feruloyl esterase family alpha/beta hydrolase [unclassified Herbaspirillum]|uniref:tannase/feruloyl esterase family alpha/beta hydrolase n=1 Tax=unclassified Herbaspirillum TaxID=2624150 RepID=UPI001152C816|nr:MULTISPECIES: tannase/feruloyl esterase family alpha/beta hydrolase [unclassified Herbaspirillum]MBB5392661.1 feruloyl esterase [Herbaspirillum sp. SJZ102]TQK06297.1 feruloyl esterase [Herbaspirillum sp. SJZ130]TQK12225.1 feruloyl esterase [Herbaspirillum sp. SJZ106]